MSEGFLTRRGGSGNQVYEEALSCSGNGSTVTAEFDISDFVSSNSYVAVFTVCKIGTSTDDRDYVAIRLSATLISNGDGRNTYGGVTVYESGGTDFDTFSTSIADGILTLKWEGGSYGGIINNVKKEFAFMIWDTV